MHYQQRERARRAPCPWAALAIVLAAFSNSASGGGPGVITTFEEQTYRHPAPASDQAFYPVSDISSKYVAAIGHRGTNFTATEFNAFIFDAVTGDHLWTFTQPVPQDDVNFRFASIAVDGDLAVVGVQAHARPAGGGIAYNAGFALVYDLKTGQLKHTLLSDSPGANFLLGSSVDVSGDVIAVGSWGNAYLFDANSGEQLTQLAPSTPSRQFGISVALSESAVVVGANSDTTKGEFTGAVFTFDRTTFAEVSKFVPADATAYDNFGIQLDVDGDYAIASSSRNAAYVFNINSGELLRTLTMPGNTFNYPNRVAIEGSSALVANPNVGQAMAFDWTTGAALQKLVPSDWTSDLHFGGEISITGGTAIVGAGGVLYQFAVIPEPSAWALALMTLSGYRRARPRPLGKASQKSPLFGTVA